MQIREAFVVLGLDENATLSAVKTAYRDLVKVWHPDRFVGDSRLEIKAAETLRKVNEANETLRRHFNNPIGHAPIPDGNDTEPGHSSTARTQPAAVAPESSAPSLMSAWLSIVVCVVLLFAASILAAVMKDRPVEPVKRVSMEAKVQAQQPSRQSFPVNSVPPPAGEPPDVSASPVHSQVPEKAPGRPPVWHASSAADLEDRITGSWLTDDGRFEMRHGTIGRHFPSRGNVSLVVGNYEVISNRKLRFRALNDPNERIFDVVFNAEGMVWSTAVGPWETFRRVEH